MIFLETARLGISEITITDITEVIEIENNPLVKEYICLSSYDDYLIMLSDPNIKVLGLYEGEDARVIGFVIVDETERSLVKIKRMALIEQSQGYGFEAMQEILNYYFASQANKIWLEVYNDNYKAIKLYEKIGMIKDKLALQTYKIECDCPSIIVYSIENNYPN
ncbi:GNAT family N-acetyltransferase [Erysipelotrichaceae bacterium OttesenSCG-928-M19]|nr:GNAT family N-acetyltransferase [Erysipelotrichaceae bacterium OttesenSCG-928-M19]